jgi:hypothetical protein
LAGTAADEWKLLDLLDKSWRRLLRGVSLVAEANIAPEDSRQVLLALGYVYELYKRSSRYEKLRAFRHWPACVAVAMTAIAATDYEEGTYWPKLWAAVGYHGGPQDQFIWGTTFRNSLAELGLPAFSATRQRYLGPILMHCGIPTHCLKDLLRVLTEHARRDPGMDAGSFIGWVTEVPSRMISLDKPVQSLLLEGREYAYDIVDRLIVLLDRLRDPEPDLYGIGLPQRFVDGARSLVGQKTVTLPPPSRARSHRGAWNKPRLALDPFGSGPQVMLPDAAGTWRVSVDGNPTDIRVSAGWEGQDSPATTFPLPRPARHVQVMLLDAAEPPTTFTVVRDEDPLLVFSEDGEFLPPSQPLPSAAVWVLYREDLDLVQGREARVISEGEIPFGWDQWTLKELDLTEVRQLGVSKNHIRKVRNTGQPRLMLDAPVPGVATAHHQPVYPKPPEIALPEGDLARTWWIELQNEISDTYTAPVRVTAQSGVVDPWRGLDRPVIGNFELSIVGPLGFRLYRRVCVADGLSVQYEPAVRLLTHTGLDRAEAQVTGSAALSQVRLTFGEDQAEAMITYGGTTLYITPPHLSVLRDDGTNRARWSAKPLHLDTESFRGRDPGLLLVRGLGTLRAPPLEVVSSDIIQEVHASGVQHEGRARYPLTQIKDTMAYVQRADLQLRVGERVVPAASVQPYAFATGADWIGGQVRLASYRKTPGLHAGVYQVYAPWRGVTVLPVRMDGVIPFPSQLREPGPIRVYLAQLTANSPWPRWPPRESLLVQAPACPAGKDDSERGLIAFLAGHGGLPPADHLERLWLVDALAALLQADGAREDLRRQCDMSLRADPASALVALSGTQVSPAEAVTALIRTGLAALRPADRITPEQTRHVWARLPSVAAVLSASVMSDPMHVPELLGFVAADHGTAAADLLAGQSDPLARTAAIAERSLAPGALIDPARVMAELRQHDDAGLTRQVPELVPYAEDLLAQTRYAALASRIRARPDGTLRMSAALALTARAGAASGSQSHAFQRHYRPFWTDLAQAYPDLVSLDIVIAQAAVSAVDRQQ